MIAAVAWRRPYLFVWLVPAVLVSDAIALALKQLFGRPRPFITYPEPEPLVRTPLDLSFPSGHAATSFAAATVLAATDRRVAVGAYVVAAAVAWSRVYVGVHYPVDILGGAVLGVVVASVVAFLGRRWERRRASGAQARAS